MSSKHLSNGRSFFRALAGPDLADLLLEVAEVATDKVAQEEFLREIPVYGIGAKALRAVRHVREELFVRKLHRFLSELKDVTPKERSMLLQKYPDGSPEQHDLGENLLLALDRIDSVEKPVVLARFFTAYMADQFDYPTFSRLWRSLERFNIALLPQLRWYYTRQGTPLEVSEDLQHEFSLCGLLTVSLEQSGLINGSADYRYSSIGKIFLDVGFGVRSE